MKHITLTGRAGCGKTNRAQELYRYHAAQGFHVILEDEGDIRNSLPERRMSAADVLITTRLTEGDFSETTTDTTTS